MIIVAIIFAFVLGFGSAIFFKHITNSAAHVGSLNYHIDKKGLKTYWIAFNDEKAMDKLDGCHYVILDVSEAR